MSLRPSSRAEQRRKHSKKTIDADEARKKREEVSIEIRKSKREEQMQKRRLQRARSQHLYHHRFTMCWFPHVQLHGLRLPRCNSRS